MPRGRKKKVEVEEKQEGSEDILSDEPLEEDETSEEDTEEENYE